MTACIRGCTHRTPDAKPVPVQTTDPDLLCRRCTAQLDDWLIAIPDTYALLPTVAAHGTVDTNPESKATKRPVAPAPMRLEVSDLLDERRGRKWDGTVPADDLRGALGIVESWARMVREERHATPPRSRPTVTTEARCLLRNLPWVVQQPWVDELYDDLRTLARTLGDAVGDYHSRPVGVCQVDTKDGRSCGGPLLPSTTGGGVHCARCGDTWTAHDLRRLGTLLAESGA